jgi:hypothetical protein
MKRPRSPLSPWERVRENPCLIFLLVILFLLSACGSQPEATAPISTSVPPTVTIFAPTKTSIANTETPAPTPDPTLFGAILQNEIQAYALESVANAIFVKTMDGYISTGGILEYQVTSVTIFPENSDLLSEIIFNVRTTDPAWLQNDGIEATDDWIFGKCYRFDFFTTETEYQLKNQRTCN